MLTCIRVSAHVHADTKLPRLCLSLCLGTPDAMSESLCGNSRGYVWVYLWTISGGHLLHVPALNRYRIWLTCAHIVSWCRPMPNLFFVGAICHSIMSIRAVCVLVNVPRCVCGVCGVCTTWNLASGQPGWYQYPRTKFMCSLYFMSRLSLPFLNHKYLYHGLCTHSWFLHVITSHHKPIRIYVHCCQHSAWPFFKTRVSYEISEFVSY